MRMLTKAVGCPLCGRPATITLFEQVDQIRGTEGHRIEFACAGRGHELSEVELLRLWAADRATGRHESSIL